MPARSVHYPSSCIAVPIGWVRADGPVRREGCVRAFGRRFLHKVKMTGRKASGAGRDCFDMPSTKIRQRFDTCGYPIGPCSQTALLLLRQLFDKSSTALRLFFDNYSKDCRRTVEEQWENPRRNVGAGIAQVISGYGRQWDGSRRSVGESGLNPLLIPYTLLLISGDISESRYYSERAYEKATGDKELFLVKGATHVAMYDIPQYVNQALEKLTVFFNGKM